jgi:hypothetical protein
MTKEVKAPEPGDDQATTRGIGKTAYLRLLGKCRSAQTRMDEEKASLGGMISDAVEGQALHKGAFAWARKIDKMFRNDSAKAIEFLYQFDVMRGHSEWDKQADMLPDRHRDQAVGEEATGEPEPHDSPSELVENGAETLRGLKPLDPEQDIRPRHLRTGSSDPDPNAVH